MVPRCARLPARQHIPKDNSVGTSLLKNLQWFYVVLQNVNTPAGVQILPNPIRPLPDVLCLISPHPPVPAPMLWSTASHAFLVLDIASLLALSLSIQIHF